MEKALPLLRKHIVDGQKELLPILVSTRKRVEGLLTKSAKDAGFLRSGSKRERVYKEVREHYEKMQKELEGWGNDVVGSTSKDFFKKAGVDTDEALSMVKYDREYAKKYFEFVHPKNSPALAATQTSKMLDSDMRQLRAAVVETFREASVSGMTAVARQKLMESKMVDVADKLNSWQFIDKSGRNWKKGNYFNMLNRTTAQRVANEAYVDGLVEGGHDLATIEGGGDPCPDCAAWRGVIVSVSGASKKFPSKADAEGAGVFHPNCVCELAYADETVDKDKIKTQSDMPNPEKPAPEAWREYAKKIEKRAKPKTPVKEAPKALKVNTKLDKKLKKENVVK